MAQVKIYLISLASTSFYTYCIMFNYELKYHDVCQSTIKKTIKYKRVTLHCESSSNLLFNFITEA